MIFRTFLFLDKVSEKKEKNIWNQGIYDWNDFLRRDNVIGISKRAKKYFDIKIKEAKKALLDYDSSFFLGKLKKNNWRLYDYFKDDCIFLDIEVSRREDISIIGMFDGINTKTMVKNVNLDKKLLLNEIKKYKLLVTFNGSSFDLPKIEKYFNCKIEIPHIDLKHLCRKIGLTGGLKQIEKQLGIKRNNIFETYSGNPSDLYKAWRATGDDYFIQKLIEYNEDDIYYLKKIMDFVYNKLVEKTIT